MKPKTILKNLKQVEKSENQVEKKEKQVKVFYRCKFKHRNKLKT